MEWRIRKGIAVAIYEYRCDDDGAFDVTLPVGTAPEAITCPVCKTEASRVFSKPMLSSLPRALVAAVDHAEKSRTEPEVVTSLPRTGARKRTPVLPLTPTLRRLPRP
jgi:putative FmdB family regulatory protein